MTLKKIETDFEAIYSSGKRVSKEVIMPVEEFAEL